MLKCHIVIGALIFFFPQQVPMGVPCVSGEIQLQVDTQAYCEIGCMIVCVIRQTIFYSKTIIIIF